MKFISQSLLFLSFLLISIFSFAQESLYLPLENQGIWQVVDQDSLSSGTQAWTLLHPGEEIDDYSECLKIQRTVDALNLSVDQMVNRLVQNAQSEMQRGKITMIEKHSGIDVREEWSIFLIESPAPKKRGNSQTILYLVYMGENHTYVVQRKTQTEKLSGSEKKSWRRIYKAAEIRDREMSKVLQDLAAR